jgi:hypothetical protein
MAKQVEVVEVKAVNYGEMSDEDLKAACKAEAGAGKVSGGGGGGGYDFYGIGFSGRMGEVLRCCMEGMLTTVAIGRAVGITSRNADSQKGYLRDKGIAFIKEAGVSCKVREAESVRRTRSYVNGTGRYVSGHEASAKGQGTKGQGYWEYTLADGTLERSY